MRTQPGQQMTAELSFSYQGKTNANVYSNTDLLKTKHPE